MLLFHVLIGCTPVWTLWSQLFRKFRSTPVQSIQMLIMGSTYPASGWSTFKKQAWDFARISLLFAAWTYRNEKTYNASAAGMEPIVSIFRTTLFGISVHQWHYATSKWSAVVWSDILAIAFQGRTTLYRGANNTFSHLF